MLVYPLIHQWTQVVSMCWLLWIMLQWSWGPWGFINCSFNLENLVPWKRSLPSWSLCANGSRQTADLNSTYMRHFPIMISTEKQIGQQKKSNRVGPFFRAVSEEGPLRGCSSDNRAELLWSLESPGRGRRGWREGPGTWEWASLGGKPWYLS